MKFLLGFILILLAGVKSFSQTLHFYPGDIINAYDLQLVRDAVDAKRNSCLQADYPWSESVIPKVTPIKKQHLDELRTALKGTTNFYNHWSDSSFTDPTIVAGETPIKAIHFSEIKTMAAAIVCPPPTPPPAPLPAPTPPPPPPPPVVCNWQTVSITKLELFYELFKEQAIPPAYACTAIDDGGTAEACYEALNACNGSCPYEGATNTCPSACRYCGVGGYPVTRQGRRTVICRCI